MLTIRDRERKFRVGHLACGIGAGAAGFNDAEARVRNVRATFECAGGIDVDPQCIENFDMMTGAKGTVLDLFDEDQYLSYHGVRPPADWREACPDDLRRAFGGPVDVIFSTPPCRGMTSLITNELAVSPRYEALNKLTTRSVMLAMEAFADDGLKLFLLENVPGLASKGRKLLNNICAILRHHGFSVAEDVHDCGEIGGLAQHRRRFLLVARHMARIPAFLYQPPKQRMRTIGEVFAALPLPGDPAAGPMHRIPELNWKTWKRLAFIEAGSDWRSLNDLAVGPDGTLRDWAIAPLGGRGIAVRNPVPPRAPHNQVLGVRGWEGTTGVVAGASRPQNGAYSVADPRCAEDGMTGEGLPTYRIVPAGNGTPIGAVQATGTRGGRGKYRVTADDQIAGTVIGNSTTGEGAYAMVDNRPWRIGDTPEALPADTAPLVARIIARDGTWHRSFTCLELAALQSLLPPDMTGPFDLVGRSETNKRLWIGNAVPRAAAKGMAETMLRTLLLADMGETFELSSEAIWTMPLGIALTVDTTAPGGAVHAETAWRRSPMNPT